ncbi:MAG: ferritin family protein [Elusimicrobiota bacterium]
MNEESREIIANAIQMEKDGINFYKDAAKNVENPLAKKMFKSIIDDEKRHLKIFKTAAKQQGMQDIGEEKAKEFNKKMQTIFSNIPESVARTLDAHTQEIEAIKGAIKIEEKGIKYYSEKCMQTQGMAKDLCSFVVQEEKNHRRFLENTLNYLEQNMNWNIENEGWFFTG